MKHQHRTAHRTRGEHLVIEVCDCGATREVRLTPGRGETVGEWHACADCTLSYGRTA